MIAAPCPSCISLSCPIEIGDDLRASLAGDLQTSNHNTTEVFQQRYFDKTKGLRIDESYWEQGIAMALFLWPASQMQGKIVVLP
jgi:hypothetical protein